MPNLSVMILRRVDLPDPFPPAKIVISENVMSDNPLAGKTAVVADLSFRCYSRTQRTDIPFA